MNVLPKIHLCRQRPQAAFNSAIEWVHEETEQREQQLKRARHYVDEMLLGSYREPKMQKWTKNVICYMMQKMQIQGQMDLVLK